MKVQNIKDINAFFKMIDTCDGTVELVTGEGDRVRIEFDSAYETAMLMRGGDNVRSASRGNLLTQCGWCRGAFDVTVIVCNGVAEFQLPGDHVLLTGCTLRPPYAIDAYARGDMDVQAK